MRLEDILSILREEELERTQKHCGMYEGERRKKMEWIKVALLIYATLGFFFAAWMRWFVRDQNDRFVGEGALFKETMFILIYMVMWFPVIIGAVIYAIRHPEL